MCGICGLAGPAIASTDTAESIARMTETLYHRGPDDRGQVVLSPPELPCPAALGATRLAIIDITPSGHQPMSNEDRSIWVAFNGEIYNFAAVRADLVAKGHSFRSHTDTEVIVHLYEELGAGCFDLLDGMFAVAILDARHGTLTLARDHIGIKPLYYCALPDRIMFGSEIKAILASGIYRTAVNWQAVHDYFTFLFVPGPETMFEGIRALPPAHTLRYDLGSGEHEVRRFWAPAHREDVATSPLEELLPRVRSILERSVRQQMVSDVPLGVFLSGGVDSTIVTGIAREADPSLRTFTATFEGPGMRAYDESEAARAISRHLGTEHHELNICMPHAAELLDLVRYFDQPFGNPTSYLTYLISQAARSKVTVALTGTGGDEMYAGYPRYRAMGLADRVAWVPGAVFKLAGRSLRLLHDDYRTTRLRRAREFFGGWDSDPIVRYAQWTYFLSEAEKPALLRSSRAFLPSDRVLRAALENSVLDDARNRLLHLDVQTFLVDNLLEYSDKMSMAASLEMRVPLLDKEFVEFSLNVPFEYKLQGARTKVLLRKAFPELFPPDFHRLPKRGFVAPLPQWMMSTLDAYFDPQESGPLGLHEHLDGEAGVTWREGILDKDYIDVLRRDFAGGKQDTSHALFAIIMFDVWWRMYVSSGIPSSAATTVPAHSIQWA